MSLVLDPTRLSVYQYRSRCFQVHTVKVVQFFCDLTENYSMVTRARDIVSTTKNLNVCFLCTH